MGLTMRHVWFALPVAAFLVALSGLLIVRGGFTPSYDSIIYYSGAESIAAGQGFVVESHYAPTGRALTNRYPPGYSTLIAGGIVSGLSPQVSAFVICVVSGAVMLVLFMLLLLREDVPPWLAAWLATGLAVNIHHLHSVTSLRAEMPSIALAMAALLALPRRPWLTGVLAGVAWTVRNAMLSLCLAVGLYYLWRREWRNAGFCLIGGILGGGWLAVCNLLNWGSVVPYSGSPSEASLVGVAWRAGTTGLAYFSVLILALFMVRPRLPRYGVLLWAGLFLAVTFYGNLRWRMDPINARLLMPVVWVVLLMAAMQWRDRAMAVFLAWWPVYSASALGRRALSYLVGE